MTKQVKVWAVLRDGRFFAALLTKREALDVCDTNRPGSKHIWAVERAMLILDSVGAYTPLCWEDGPLTVDEMPQHCILPVDHAGEHQFVRDDEITISFNKRH